MPPGVLEIRKTLDHDKSEAGDCGTGVLRQPCDTADPTGRLDLPNANPPIPQAGNVLVSQQPSMAQGTSFAVWR